MKALLVDGHSIIFAWPELRRIHSQRPSLARDQLVKILTAYQDASGVHVTLVFDGKGSKITNSTEPGEIQIIYSGSNDTADGIIERLVHRYATEHQITVATSDHQIQQTATSFNALVVSAEGLRPWLQQAEDHLAHAVKKHRNR